MDYAQNLKKDPVKAKKGPSQNFYRVLSAHFAVLQYYKEFAAILSNLFKTAILKNVLGLWVLEMMFLVHGFLRWVLIWVSILNGNQPTYYGIGY